MSLLPLVERLLGYCAGLAIWCLVVGSANRLGGDLTPIGEAGLLFVLLCTPLLLWPPLRRWRGAAGADDTATSASPGTGKV